MGSMSSSWLYDVVNEIMNIWKKLNIPYLPLIKQAFKVMIL